MRVAHLAFCFTAILVSVSFLCGAPSNENRPGVLLETTNYDWCHHDCGPFNTESVFICIQADGKTLIGDRKVDNNWDTYYSQLSNKPEMSFPVRYDEQSIWVVMQDGQQFRFDQTYEWDLFHSPACTAEIHRHMLKRLGDVNRPTSVPADASLIPEGGRFFWHYYSWVQCSIDLTEDDDICTYWDKAGHMDYADHVVSEVNRKPIPQDELQIDAYTTKHNDVRLKNGVRLISDGRARINGKLVTEQPKP